MSFLKKFFGGKKKGKDVSAMDSIQKIEETEGLLKKKQEVIETKIAEEQEIALKNAKTNKRSEFYLPQQHCLINSFQLQCKRLNERRDTKPRSLKLSKRWQLSKAKEQI